MSKESNLLLGLIVGVTVGGVAALLLSPNTGEDNRKKIKSFTDDFKNDLDDKMEKLSEKLDGEVLDSLKDTYAGSKDAVKKEYDTLTKKVKALEQEIEAKIQSIKKNTAL